MLRGPELRFSPIAGVAFMLSLLLGHHAVAAGTFAATAHIVADYALLALRSRRG